MFMPNIQQGFGLEFIMIAEICYLWFRTLSNRKTETLSAFFRLCSALMLFLLVNIPVRISDLNLFRWKPDIVFLLNAVYIALETLTAYEWFLYFLTVQETETNHLFHPKLRPFLSVPLYLMLFLLAASYKTHWLFYVDENSMYQRGSLFFLQLLIPYLYLIASFFSAYFGYKKSRNKRMFVIFLFSFITSAITSFLQVLYSGSFNHAGLCLAVLLIYMEMYQYEIKQIENMKSLAAVNQQLEDVNAKLNETVKELEISVANEKTANNAKNDFLSRMSHDIRTPLNGILGLIAIDERHPEDIALLSQNRQKAKTAANHLISLINDILDMSKLSSGKYELSHEPFDMSAMISDVLTIVHSSADTAGITLINENESDPFDYPLTFGSPLHIKRVLLNIIGNAIKYNKDSGSVRVRLEHELSDHSQIRYTVTVTDTGIGMSEEYLRTLFEPFSQEHIDARSVYEGSGLGMAISKALIDLMGGTLDVQSKVGEGSVFLVGLTFDIAEKTADELTAEDHAEDLQGIRILLAEDNELNIEIAQLLLEESGASVDVAENGQIALDRFRDQPAGTYDVILMDCMMPVLDGFQATKAIRALERPDALSIPIIAMTANAFADDVKKCLDAGMNEHLSKPFEIEKVIRTVRKYAYRANT